jgi:hypothetical protein
MIGIFCTISFRTRGISEKKNTAKKPATPPKPANVIPLHHIISEYPVSLTQVCLCFYMWGDVGGRRCDVQSANTLECPSAKIGLHRVSSLVSLSSPSPLLPLNLFKSLLSPLRELQNSLRAIRTLVRRIVRLELGRRDASRGIELPQTLSAS